MVQQVRRTLGPMSTRICHVCGASAFQQVSEYGKFYRVTSDCSAWPAGGTIGVCHRCGCIQKLIDSRWEAETKKIYEAYSIYHQGDGVEQSVFEEGSGQACPRSDRILSHLQAQYQLSKTGRLLDVGCGNGAFLRTFNTLARGWSMIGTELNDKYRSTVERIEGVERLHVGQPEDVPGTFAVVTMVHLLEHIVSPRDFLIRLRDKMEPDSLLVIQVPDYTQNPFDLLIADHCSHFTVETLRALLGIAGYDAFSIASDCVPKELTVFARKSDQKLLKPEMDAAAIGTSSLLGSLRWLDQVAQAARQLAQGCRIGLFGTSIAATWLHSQLEEAVGFFVDEDPNRFGREYLDLPVLHPSAVADRNAVFVALPPPMACNVAHRLARPGVSFHCPPPFPDVAQ